MSEKLKRHKTVAEALKHVADNPAEVTPPIEQPIWEVISRNLFVIANSPDSKVRGSVSRSTRAQKLLLDRLVGKRRSGTLPVQENKDELQFVDLTKGEVT